MERSVIHTAALASAGCHHAHKTTRAVSIAGRVCIDHHLGLFSGPKFIETDDRQIAIARGKVGPRYGSQTSLDELLACGQMAFGFPEFYQIILLLKSQILDNKKPRMFHHMGRLLAFA